MFDMFRLTKFDCNVYYVSQAYYNTKLVEFCLAEVIKDIFSRYNNLNKNYSKRMIIYMQ